MATAKCAQCGKDVSVGQAFCPHCGASADNIRKAAAGLEALVTLGGVVHEGGALEIDELNLETLCRRFQKDRPDGDFVYHDARAGNTNAMMMIGSIYWEGKRVRKDRNQGEKWFRLALKHGDSGASEMLELCAELKRT